MNRRTINRRCLSSCFPSALSVVLCGVVVGAIHCTACAQDGERGGGMSGCGERGSLGGTAVASGGFGRGSMSSPNALGVMQVLGGVQRMRQMQQMQALFMAR